MDFFKKNALLFVALVGWVITAYSLYFIQYKMFDGAVQTVFAYSLIFVPCLLISNFFNLYKKERKENKKLEVSISIVSIVAILWCTISSPYNASIWNIVIVAIVGLVLSIKKDFARKLKDKDFIKERCMFVTVIFMLIIAQPLIFASVVDAKSINTAQNMLQGDTSYVTRITNFDILGLQTDVLDVNHELGFYVFTSDNNTITFVSVISGKSLGNYNILENSILKALVNHYTK